MSYLLDTNVISEARKGPRSKVQGWFASVSGDELFLSVLVVGEIRRGIECLRWRKDLDQVRLFETWLAQLQGDFADRLLPVTAEVAELWGRLNVPDPVPTVDGLMAATALVHDLTFVTHNLSDVAATGVRLLDPWAWDPSDS